MTRTVLHRAQWALLGITLILVALGALWMQHRPERAGQESCADYTIAACREHPECALVYDPIYKDGVVINSGFAPHCADRTP